MSYLFSQKPNNKDDTRTTIEVHMDDIRDIEVIVGYSTIKILGFHKEYGYAFVVFIHI